MTPTIAPGWYPIPGGEQIGYWDGYGWLENTIGWRRTSGLAVASLVTAIVFVVAWCVLALMAMTYLDSFYSNRNRVLGFCLLGPLVPVGLGIAALKTIGQAEARGPRPLRGRAAAACGILVSSTFWLLTFLLWLGATTGN